MQHFSEELGRGRLSHAVSVAPRSAPNKATAPTGALALIWAVSSIACSSGAHNLVADGTGCLLRLRGEPRAGRGSLSCKSGRSGAFGVGDALFAASAGVANARRLAAVHVVEAVAGLARGVAGIGGQGPAPRGGGAPS